MAAGTRVVLLGGFRLWREGAEVVLPMTAQRVVALVALHDRPVLRSHVGATLWLDAPEDRAAANLRSALWRLRRAGCDVVRPTGPCLELSPRARVDVRDGQALASLAISSPSWWVPGDGDAALLATELLPGWYDEWVLPEREGYRQLRLHALESMCIRLAERGRHALAVQTGLTVVAADPLRESAQAALIKAFLAEGNVGEARRQFERFRTLLRGELGLEPSESLTRLLDIRGRAVRA